ncbi:FG-GAP-like repeat-containing protein [soil metagenome]
MRRKASLLIGLSAMTVLMLAGTALAAPVAPEFRVPDQYRAGTVPSESVIADLDGDGDGDIAVTDIGFDGGINVFLGDGSGNLSGPINSPLPADGGSIDIVAADFDGDGTLDLAVASLGGGTSRVVILLGNGDGTFRVGALIPAAGLSELTTADFDGDGDPDLAYSHGSIDGDVIKVILNNGDGTFGPPQSYEPPFFIGLESLTARDVNNDGAPDLVFMTGCPKVRLNQGDGTFGPEICSTDPQGRIGGITFALGDYNGDGDIDMAVGDASGGHVAIALGSGDGRFTFFQEYSNISTQVNSVVSADLTGDGRLDLLAGSITGVATLMQGRSDGTFTKFVRWITGGADLNLGDLGGSALPDVLSAGGLVGTEISVSLNLGKGKLHAPRMFDATGKGGSLQLGDLNGDGRDDVAFVVSSSSIEAHLAGRNGVFGRAVVSPIVANDTVSLRLADLNEDGHLDAVGALDASPNVYVALGTGTGSFGAPTRFSNGSANTTPSGLAVADVNADGNLDLISGTPSQLSVLPGTGTGSFGPPILSGKAGGSAQVATLIADFNGDGKLDAAAPTVTGSSDYAGMAMYVNHGTGTGTFTLAYTRTTDTNVTSAAVGDLDGDGDPDVVNTGFKGSNGGRTGLFVWKNQGGTLATTPVLYTSQASTVLLADVNRDGSLDAVTMGGIFIGIHLNNGDGTFAPQMLIPVAADSVSLKAGDITGDDVIDLMVLYGSIGKSSFAPYVNETP